MVTTESPVDSVMTRWLPVGFPNWSRSFPLMSLRLSGLRPICLAAMMIIYGETQQGKDAGVPIMDWAFANEPTLHRNENTTKCRFTRHFV